MDEKLTVSKSSFTNYVKHGIMPLHKFSNNNLLPINNFKEEMQMPVKCTELSEAELAARLKPIRTEAEHAHYVVTTFFAKPSALQQYEQILTHEYYAHYDKFRNQVDIISKNEKNWAVHCSVETIYGCHRAAYIIEKKLPVLLSDKEKHLAQVAAFLRSWVSECERYLANK